jgi:uncharacterized protein
MRDRLLGTLALLVLLAAPVGAADARLPALRGFVTDEAGVLSPAERARLTAVIEGLRTRTGAEIAVVTVPTTAPLDDFSYAMRLAETWKPGHEKTDTGVVFLVATQDRKLRVLVGYGLEGILPDGLVGEIQDREVVPEFRAGRLGAGIVRGVEALATRIERGLAGEERPPAPRAKQAVPAWVVLLVILVVVAMLLYEARNNAHGFGGRRRRRGPIVWPGGFGGFGGGRGGFDGFGGGGGGFGGFGGGSFGGGGAGRSW